VDIDLLRTFVAICEMRSFTGAARHVGRTQSAVSLQMRRLEESLDRPLFYRGSSSVRLTEHGELLRAHAVEILAGVDRTLAAFDRSSPAGVVVIGLPDDYAPRVLPFILDCTVALLPCVTIDIVLDESKTLARRLAEGAIDLAFVTEGEGPSRGGPVAFRDRIVWVGPAGKDIHLSDPVPIALWGDDDSYSRPIFDTFKQTGRRHRVAVVSQSMTGLRAAVTSGHAISTMVSSSMVEGMRELTEADGYPRLRDVAIRLERAHRKKSAVIDRLEAHLVERFAEFSGR
jgi:DNA-binding transcriptional LysR family regulator